MGKMFVGKEGGLYGSPYMALPGPSPGKASLAWGTSPPRAGQVDREWTQDPIDCLQGLTTGHSLSLCISLDAVFSSVSSSHLSSFPLFSFSPRSLSSPSPASIPSPSPMDIHPSKDDPQGLGSGSRSDTSPPPISWPFVPASPPLSRAFVSSWSPSSLGLVGPT